MNPFQKLLHRLRVRRAAAERRRMLTVAAAIQLQDAAQAAQDGYAAAQAENAAQPQCHIVHKQAWFGSRWVRLSWPDMTASYGLN